MILEEVKQKNIPKLSGSYQFFNKNDEIIYIGKAANLNIRVLSYWQKSTQLSSAKKKMLLEIERIEWIETETEIEAFLLESNLIKKYQPYYNISLRDDKRFAYIKISLEDDIPGIFITRKIDKQGKYFGPFTSVISLREVLKIIRKIWPYCTEGKLQKKPCFSAQIGRCTGVCAGRQEIEDYKAKIIKPIVLFLEGKKKRLIINYQLRITNLERKIKGVSRIEKEKSSKSSLELELLEIELRKLKYDLLNMKKVLAHANIISVSEKYASDVVELAKIFNLPKIPEKIEGYDISNIFGAQAVGSMVVFKEGEASKKDYRKFKIKIGQGKASDTGMLKEVLSRRLKHFPPSVILRSESDEESRGIIDNASSTRFFASVQDDKVNCEAREGSLGYNSLVVINADGTVMDNYRKTHIPDGPGYEEKFYFKPGDSGFKVYDTSYGKIGVGICWDQWFCETARALALMGAEIIFYPTAIGSEPEIHLDSKEHWQRVQMGHAATNTVPVVVANRIGEEIGESCSLTFYGSSFITDYTGDKISEASRDKEEIIYAEFDLDENKKQREYWGLLKDRRPDMYKDIC
ncbi:MAG: GIY-YIG nuclease family protein [Sulfurimonas sp.]|nr:GIY-YIG nuclease family protein [Sulfurimonas sp.]